MWMYINVMMNVSSWSTEWACPQVCRFFSSWTRSVWQINTFCGAQWGGSTLGSGFSILSWSKIIFSFYVLHVSTFSLTWGRCCRRCPGRGWGWPAPRPAAPPSQYRELTSQTPGCTWSTAPAWSEWDKICFNNTLQLQMSLSLWYYFKLIIILKI